MRRPINDPTFSSPFFNLGNNFVTAHLIGLNKIPLVIVQRYNSREGGEIVGLFFFPSPIRREYLECLSLNFQSYIPIKPCANVICCRNSPRSRAIFNFKYPSLYEGSACMDTVKLHVWGSINKSYT